MEKVQGFLEKMEPIRNKTPIIKDPKRAVPVLFEGSDRLSD